MMLEAAARDATADAASAPVYDPGAPCTIEVELASPDHADAFRHRTGVTLTDTRTVTSTAPTWWDAWRNIYL
jgi:D-amino peptidase